MFLHFHVLQNEAHKSCDLLISRSCTELIHQSCLTTTMWNKWQIASVACNLCIKYQFLFYTGHIFPATWAIHMFCKICHDFSEKHSRCTTSNRTFLWWPGHHLNVLYTLIYVKWQLGKNNIPEISAIHLSQLANAHLKLEIYLLNQWAVCCSGCKASK